MCCHGLWLPYRAASSFLCCMHRNPWSPAMKYSTSYHRCGIPSPPVERDLCGISSYHNGIEKYHLLHGSACDLGSLNNLTFELQRHHAQTALQYVSHTSIGRCKANKIEVMCWVLCAGPLQFRSQWDEAYCWEGIISSVFRVS